MFHRDIGTQDRHIRAGNRANTVVSLAGHPGDDRAIVEPDHKFASHRNFAATAANERNEVAAALRSERHKISETDYSLGSLELGLKDW